MHVDDCSRAVLLYDSCKLIQIPTLTPTNGCKDCMFCIIINMFYIICIL